MSGDAFTKTDVDVDKDNPAAFNLRAWIRGTSPVTRSCTVYGRPDLMGEIEALKDQLAEIQSGDFDDDRPLARSAGLDVAEQIEQLRTQMHASALRFRFRGLRNGELEEVKAEMGRDDDDPDGVGELDYRLMARQCVTPEGVGWEDFRDLHTSLGNYFARTLLRTSIEAVQGGGVDVPFSSASSALTTSSPKS